MGPPLVLMWNLQIQKGSVCAILYKRFEHPSTWVSAGVLELIPHGYPRVTVIGDMAYKERYSGRSEKRWVCYVFYHEGGRCLSVR